jgi:thiaminase
MEQDCLYLETPAKSYVSMFKEAITTAEFQLASRISYHINELQQLPANVAEDVQLKAMQQLHMLRVKDLQSKV